jgi:hypothetical protein
MSSALEDADVPSALLVVEIEELERDAGQEYDVAGQRSRYYLQIALQINDRLKRRRR